MVKPLLWDNGRVVVVWKALTVLGGFLDIESADERVNCRDSSDYKGERRDTDHGSVHKLGS